MDGTPEALVASCVDRNVSFNQPAAAVILDKGKCAEEFKPPMRAFAVKDDVCIQLFRVDGGDFIRKFGEGILKSPRGLAINEEGNLMTLNYAIHGGMETELLVFDPVSGSLVRREPYAPLSNYQRDFGKGASGRPNKGPQPRFVDCHEDVLAISDLGLDLVYMTSVKTGQELRRFGTKGKVPGCFMFVSGITFDGAGNMLIGDAKNNRVQLFDKNGKFVCVLDFGGTRVEFVSDIHLTATGLLMVMCRYLHVVYVFKLEPKD